MEKKLTELYQQRITCMNNLLSTDYKAIKYAEGVYSEEEYAPLKLQRQAWRDEINAIDKQIEELKKAEVNNGTNFDD